MRQPTKASRALLLSTTLIAGCVAQMDGTSGPATDSGAAGSGSGSGSDVIVPDAVCGDALCNGSETCGSCASDCTCTAVNPCGFDPTLPFDFLGNVLQLESADKTTCMWISRTLSGGCVTTACVQAKFMIVAARIGHGGSVVSLGAGDQLTWTDSHHNFDDIAQLVDADTIYTLNLKGTEPRPAVFDPSVPSNLSATPSTAAGANWGPVTLVPFTP